VYWYVWPWVSPRPGLPHVAPVTGVTVWRAASLFVQTTVLLTFITTVMVAGENPHGLLGFVQLLAPDVILT